MKPHTRIRVPLSVINYALMCTSAFFTVQASTFDEISQAVAQSTTHLQLRYRLESVNQPNKVDNALASTLKSRLTWQSNNIGDFSSLVELDNVALVGNDLYNATNNGKSNYPVVADPKGTDLNQALIKYQHNALTLTAGRQRINLQDQRFVGGVAWRQNEQTFDGLRVQYHANQQFTIDYSYVYNINRIFGPTDGVQLANWKGNFHLLNSQFKFNGNQSITGFAYLLDNYDALAAATNTYGVGYQGKFNAVSAKLRYARQSDAGKNPHQFTSQYYLAQLSTQISNVKLVAGYEVLGSDNGVGFSTPLATLHKFQGFADTFLTTPVNGIKDGYLTAAAKLSAVTVAATYHNFKSAKNSINYGYEWDIVAKYPINKQTKLLAKFASYKADQLGTDTTKFWLMATMSF